MSTARLIPIPKGGFTALVTAGSTIGRLDAVRFSEQLTYLAGEKVDTHLLFDSQNPFKGKLGLYIADELHRQGWKTLLIARKDLLRGEKHDLPDSCIQPFTTFEDLQTLLPAALKAADPELVFMSAAVSDYVPVGIEDVSDAAREGKISSELQELRVRYRATPKLIDGIRPLVHPLTSIVGFKLVVGLSEAAMREAALKQMARAHSRFCVVNDYRELAPDGSSHPVRLFYPSGTMLRFDGTKHEVARQIATEVVNDYEDTCMQTGGRERESEE